MLPPPPAADAGGVLLRRASRSGPHHYPRLIYSGGGGGGGDGVGVRSTGTGYFPPPTFCFPLSVGHAARLGSARREIEEERKKKRPRHAAPGRCKNKRNGSSRAVCVAYSRRAVRVCVCVCRCQWIRHGTGRAASRGPVVGRARLDGGGEPGAVKPDGPGLAACDFGEKISTPTWHGNILGCV